MARLGVPVGGRVRKLRAVRELDSSPSKDVEKIRIFGGSPRMKAWRQTLQYSPITTSPMPFCSLD